MRTGKGYFPIYRWKDGVLLIKSPTGDFVDSKKIDPQLFYTMNMQLLMHNSGAQYQENLEEEVHVKLRPFIAKRLGYCRDECVHTEPVTRSSTGGWYARLLHGRSPAVFIVQEIKSKDSLWLTIIDESIGEVFESHPIRIHEGYALPPQSFRTTEDQHLFNSSSREEVIEPLLEGTTPDFQSLLTLIGDAEIPHLRFGGFEPKESVRETLEQLVPERWSQSVREEVMAFLSYIMSDPASIDSSIDPVSFSFQFLEVPQFRNLTMLHQIRLLRGEKDYSKYLPLMWQHEKLTSPKDSSETIDGTDISSFVYSEIVRDTTYYDRHVQDYLISMKNARTVPAGLPVSKEEASKSKEARLQRLMHFVGALYILGRVNHQSIGLRNMIYIGKAIQWPHQHLEYTLTLDDTKYKSRPAMIHSISVPPEAEEVLLKERTKILPVSWYVRRTNPRIWSTEDADHRFNYERLLASLDPQYEMRSFERGYDLRKPIRPYNELDDNDIRVMDLISSYLFLSDLEFPSVVKSLGFDSAKQITSSIEKLAANDVLSLIYDMMPGRVKTLAIIARGNEGCILSLFRALLQNAPRCSCYSLDSGKQYLAFVGGGRAVGNAFQHLLPAWAEENGVKLTCSFCSTAGNYRNNLFQRLRKEDEAWDSDITGLLAQMGK